MKQHSWDEAVITRDGSPAIKCSACGWVWKASHSQPKWECGTRPVNKPQPVANVSPRPGPKREPLITESELQDAISKLKEKYHGGVR